MHRFTRKRTPLENVKLTPGLGSLLYVLLSACFVAERLLQRKDSGRGRPNDPNLESGRQAAFPLYNPLGRDEEETVHRHRPHRGLQSKASYPLILLLPFLLRVSSLPLHKPSPRPGCNVRRAHIRNGSVSQTRHLGPASRREARPHHPAHHTLHGRGRPARRPYRHHGGRRAAVLRVTTLPQEQIW